MQCYRPWIFNDEPYDEISSPELVGFVYLIRNLDNGRKYIGKKSFYQIRKVKGKKRRVRSESNWRRYHGSSKDLKADYKALGGDMFARTILHLCSSKRAMSYLETFLLFKCDVLASDEFYNENIGGKFWEHFD